jgi:Pregnancy-associated plasma protein-A
MSRMRRFFLGGLVSASALGLLSGAVAPTASAIPAEDHAVDQHCDAPANARAMKGTSAWGDPNTLTRKAAAAMEARNHRILQRSGVRPTARPNGAVKIRIHFHAITDRDGNGFVTKSRIKRQIRVLNRAFGGRTGPASVDTPFRFRLASIERIKRNRWYNANYFTKRGKLRLREMRRELRVGDALDLNVYTIGPKFGLLGMATFPGKYRKFPRLDGVVLLNGSLPGGIADFGPGLVYNRGDTATHEVGHWLNLYHTFQGSCGALNDYVTDTPKQKDDNRVFECDPRLNTCAPYGNASRDPVKNFMNYVDDRCMDRFTRGQRDRMNTAWYIRQVLAD